MNVMKKLSNFLTHLNPVLHLDLFLAKPLVAPSSQSLVISTWVRAQQWVPPGIILTALSAIAGTVLAQPSLAQPSDLQASDAGWSDWQPRSSSAEALFQSGFFNAELNGFRAFEERCQEMTGQPNDEIDYWFRVNDSVSQIGTGRIEYGCRHQGEWIDRFALTAVLATMETVDCLQVNSPVSSGLNVRAWPGYTEQIVGGIANGTMVDPGSFPASIIEVDGRNWVAIVSPVTGWVSNGSPGSSGNLVVCDPTVQVSDRLSP